MVPFPVLHFELTRLVSLCAAAAFWLEKGEFKSPKDPRNISAVKAESEP